MLLSSAKLNAKNKTPLEFVPEECFLDLISLCSCLPSRHLHNMQCDEVIWQVINQQFCSFKTRFVV